MKPVSTLIVFSVCGLAALSAYAEIYKWTDADGNTHYSERRPTSESAAVIEPLNTKPRAQRKTWQEMNEDATDAKEIEVRDAKQAAIDAEDADRKMRNCEQSRVRLASMERPRVNQIAEDGTRTVMPEEQRQSELKKAQDMIKEYCS